MEDSTPARIEKEIILRIFRKEYPVGMRLPTVRDLATQFDVNPSTIQRVVARLEAKGLILARQGSGLLINDPLTHGDVSLLPLWLESKIDDPKAAAEILADLLEVRRVLAVKLVARHRDAIKHKASEILSASARFMNAGSLEELVEADLAMLRILVLSTGNFAAISVFNTVTSVVRQHHLVARAMYADPEENMRGMAEVIAAVDEPLSQFGAVLDRVLMDLDQRTVERFLELSRGAP